jgi:sugar O-acyltransferase (sialic acid O-acetyltransferase NeuD family)
MSQTDIVIFGAGGHAKVVFDIIQKQQKFNVIGFISADTSLIEFQGLPHYQPDHLQKLKCHAGLVAIGDNSLREEVVKSILSVDSTFNFVVALHPSAQIGRDVFFGPGSVVMAGVNVNSGTVVGLHCVLNTGSNIDHDCHLQDFSSLAPGCTLGGAVQIGYSTAVSLGANIIHGISIGEHTVIGAGSTVLQNIESYVVAFGTPCKVIRRRSRGEKYL